MRGTRCSAEQHTQNHEHVTYPSAKLSFFSVHIIIVFNTEWLNWFSFLVEAMYIQGRKEHEWLLMHGMPETLEPFLHFPPCSLPSSEGLSSWPAPWQPSGTTTPPHSLQHKTSASAEQSGNIRLPQKYFKPAPGGAELSWLAPIHNPMPWTLHRHTRSVEVVAL